MPLILCEAGMFDADKAGRLVSRWHPSEGIGRSAGTLLAVFLLLTCCWATLVQ